MMSAKTELPGNAVSTGVMATRVIAIALAYYITGRLGLELAIVGSNITLIWLPTGIAVAALFRWGWRYWPAVWLGALSVNLAIGSTFPVALGISVGNTLGPMLGVALLRRWHFDPRISTWSDVPVFVVGGALLGMLVSATGGVATLVLGGLLPWPVVSTAWIAWWLGDSVGVIVAGMAFIMFDRHEFAQLLHSRARKDLVVSASVIAVLGLAWAVIPLHSLGYAFLASLGLSTLVWIALRLGPSPAAIAVLALSACAAWALATGRGPVFDQNIHLAIAKLWACITTISIVSMLMAALTSERKRADEALKESEAFNLAIMDSVAAEIVAIDCDGVILTANKRWNDFAVENSIDVGKPVAHTDVGANYLSVCQSVTGADSEAALDARNGIRAVLDGRLPMFSLHYPCHSPTQQRWFAMRVTPFGFRGQAGAVITHVDITEHKQSEEIDAFLSQVSENGAETFFAALARFLAQTLQMDYVCIDRLEGDELNATTLAVWHDGHFEDNVTYALSDTPCGDVVGQKVCCFPASVCQFFPNDGALQELRAESYIGVTLWSHTGQPIGLIAAIGRRPLTNRVHAEFTLERVASRAAGELERLNAEAAMRETEELFRSLVQAAPFGIVVNNPDGDVEYVNATFTEMLGYSIEDIPDIATWWQKAYPDPDYRQRVMATWQQTVLGQTEPGPVDASFVVCHKDGRSRDIRFIVIPLSSKRNLVTLQDVTERKQASEQIRKLSLAVEQSPASIMITDIAARIEYVNDAFIQTTGYSREEIAGKNPRILKSGKTPAEAYIALWGALAKGQLWKGELYNRRKDGSEYVEFAVITPLRQSDGSISHYVAVKEDITEKKRLVIELDQHRLHLEELVATRTIELTQALEVAKVADQTKDAFLANMSHELRTPLSAVIGIANLAQGISTEPRLRDYLEKIVRSGKHLNRIINELLDLSKIAAGRMELEIIAFSLRTVIAHVESVMSHRAAEKGLAIVMVIDDAVPDVLLGDPTRLAQIFLNLIGNALKFTQAGRVAVRVGLQAHERDRVCLDVAFEDTGIGMRPEDLKQLFQPFSQADATVSRKYGGTGLGLTISRRLAEMMDGDISVTSIEGRGTTFTVTIWLGLGNAADLPAVETAIDEALPKRYQDARILVADDQALNREIVEALLAAVGITPRLAANGQEALDILTESGPDAFDLVLMDIQMPIMDGLTATRALRGRAGFDSLPIIAMTAHTMAHEQELNAAAGMNDHIGKPFDNASFYRTLAKWIPLAKQKATGATDAIPWTPEISPAAGNELGSLRGIDVAAALARFCGNEVSYRRWLTEFVATAGAVPGQMRSEIAAGQGEKAGKTAHAFKGRVGMLGMTELHAMASALEIVLHEGRPADELLSALERLANEMCSELGRVLNPCVADKATAKEVLESVDWNDSYSVGVLALDDQHKKLIGMINRLSDCHAARNCGSSGAFHEVLSRMFDYSQVHFKAEEDYLQRIGYPQLADQKIEHAAFVGKMAGFSMAASEGVQDEAAVHRYLKDWLLSHILESDMQYRPFVESRL